MYRTFIALPYSIMGEYNRLSKAHYFIYIFNLSFLVIIKCSTLVEHSIGIIYDKLMYDTYIFNQ